MNFKSLLKIREVHPSTLAPARENVATASRRRSVDPPALHESLPGAEYRNHPSLPAAVWNRIASALAEATQTLMHEVEAAYRAGIEDNLLKLVQDDIPNQAYRLGAAVIKEVLREERGFLGSTINCDQCAGHLEFEGYKRRVIVTTLGDVEIWRAYYHGGCGHSAFPVDRLLGVEHHALVPKLQGTVSLLTSRVPYAEAVETVQRILPIRLSTHTAQQVTARVANEIRQTRKGFRPAVETPGTVAVAAVDGGFYRTRDKTEPFKEVKMGILGMLDPVPGEREQVTNKHYVVTLGDADDLYRELVSSYYRNGFQRADTLVALGDGASWIWNRMRQLLAPGQEFMPVLDFYHASEHLRDLSRVVFGEDSNEGLNWWKDMETILKESRLRLFFRRFKALKKSYVADAEKSERIAKELKYFKEREDYLNYAECRSRGLPIGSGMVEGGIRFVVKDRLDRTGMRWCPEGASDVLLLRCVDASGEWSPLLTCIDQQRLARFKKAKTAWLTAA